MSRLKTLLRYPPVVVTAGALSRQELGWLPPLHWARTGVLADRRAP